MLHKKYILLGLFTVNSIMLPIVANVEPVITEQAPALKACEICIEDKKEEEFSTLECGHTYCTQCLKNVISVALSQRSLHEIRCPRCAVPISSQKTVDIMQSSDPSEKNLYQELITFAWARQQEHLKHCPTPDCTFYFINESTCAQNITCNQCTKEYCNQCLINHDAQTSCDQARTNNQTPESAANNQWKETNSKQCPRCKINIEKNHGCDHMTCNSCRYEFCWICLGMYHCGQRHFQAPIQPEYIRRYGRDANWDASLGIITIAGALIVGTEIVNGIRAIRDLRNLPHLQLPFFR